MKLAGESEIFFGLCDNSQRYKPPPHHPHICRTSAVVTVAKLRWLPAERLTTVQNNAIVGQKPNQRVIIPEHLFLFVVHSQFQLAFSVGAVILHPRD